MNNYYCHQFFLTFRWICYRLQVYSLHAT